VQKIIPLIKTADNQNAQLFLFPLEEKVAGLEAK
jgi:hypothetical protein